MNKNDPLIIALIVIILLYMAVSFYRAATDEPVYIFYRDADGDGFGYPGDKVEATSPPPGYVDNCLDCYDDDPSRPGHPPAGPAK